MLYANGYPVGGGGGTGGHTIIDENGNSMTARAGLQFTGNIVVTDDNTNNKTIVNVPSGGGHNYSTTEQVIGTWIDGKTLYEKSYRIADIDYSTATSFKELFTIANADTIVSIVGCMTNSAHTKQYAIPYINASSGNIKFASVIFEDTASSGNAKSFFFTSNDTWGDSSVLLTVQYTKSS